MKLRIIGTLTLFSLILSVTIMSCASEKEKTKEDVPQEPLTESDSNKQETAELELVVKEAIEALPQKEMPLATMEEEFEDVASAEEVVKKPKVYFSGSPGTIHMSLERYAKIYDIESHEGQIDYLLTRMRTSKYTLERNGTRWPVTQGAEFLRWKMGRPKWQDKVHSAGDFVDVICQGSSTSGKPYLAMLPDGTVLNMGTLFSNELDFLEEFLKEKAIKEAAKTSKKEVIEKLSDSEPAGQEIVVAQKQLIKTMK